MAKVGPRLLMLVTALGLVVAAAEARFEARERSCIIADDTQPKGAMLTGPRSIEPLHRRYGLAPAPERLECCSGCRLQDSAMTWASSDLRDLWALWDDVHEALAPDAPSFVKEFGERLKGVRICTLLAEKQACVKLASLFVQSIECSPEAGRFFELDSSATNAGSDAAVNGTFHVCRGFAKDFYDACKDVQLLGLTSIEGIYAGLDNREAKLLAAAFAGSSVGAPRLKSVNLAFRSEACWAPDEAELAAALSPDTAASWCCDVNAEAPECIGITDSSSFPPEIRNRTVTVAALRSRGVCP